MLKQIKIKENNKQIIEPKLGYIYILFHRNNIKFVVLNEFKSPIFYVSNGKVAEKKKSKYATEKAIKKLNFFLFQNNIAFLTLCIKGSYNNYLILRHFKNYVHREWRYRINYIYHYPLLPHNGCRAKKSKRVKSKK